MSDKETLERKYRKVLSQFQDSENRRNKLLHLLAEEEKVYRHLQTKLANAEADLYGGPI